MKKLGYLEKREEKGVSFCANFPQEQQLPPHLTLPLLSHWYLGMARVAGPVSATKRKKLFLKNRPNVRREFS